MRSAGSVAHRLLKHQKQLPLSILRERGFSVITEDWKYRMVTPRKGHYDGVPGTVEAFRAANAWDPAKDEAAGEQCAITGRGEPRKGDLKVVTTLLREMKSLATKRHKRLEKFCEFCAFLWLIFPTSRIHTSTPFA